MTCMLAIGPVELVLLLALAAPLLYFLRRRKGGDRSLLPPFSDRDYYAYNVLRHKPKDQLTAEERQQLDEMWRKVD